MIQLQQLYFQSWVPPWAWDRKGASGQSSRTVQDSGAEMGQLAREAGRSWEMLHTGSICSSSPSMVSIWCKAAWELMTTRVAPAGKQAAQGLSPSPGPYLYHQTLYLPRTQKTAEPAPASQKKGKETAPARAY